jgi:hypothetical protein
LFGAKAIQTAEESLDLKKLTKIAESPSKSLLDYTKFLEKTLLTKGCIPDESKGGNNQK